MSITETAKKLGVSYSLVYSICREHGLGGNKKHKELDEREVKYIGEVIAEKSRPKNALDDISDTMYNVLTLLKEQRETLKQIMEVLNENE